MRQILAAAAVLGLAAGEAQAQIKPVPGVPAFPAFGAKPPPAYKPYEPPKLPSVYDDGPFSPRGELKRERRQNAAPAPGPFSPEGEAKRQREQARRYHPF